MKKMRSLSKYVYVTCLLGVLTITSILLSGCTFLPKEEPVLAPPLTEPAQLDYKTAKVEKGEIIHSVKGVGSVVPKKNQDLYYSKDGGRLKDINVVKGDTIEKGQILAELDTGNLAFEIEQAKLELKKAEIRLQQMQNEEQPNKYAIEIGRLDVQGLKNRLAFLNNQLAEARITSPINGIVTFVADIHQGDIVPAFESIFQVAETTELQLQYRANDAADIADITLGMEATIEGDKEELKGEVVQIPKSVPADVAKKDPDFYGKAIFIDMENPPEDMAVGKSIGFEIITAQKKDALIIPKNALRSIIGRNYVQLIEDNTKREIDIKVGIISSTQVEVLEGLKEGDTVIIK
ncbi:efflux RND transporter periplasmic adaptor subunit [Bacillus niameyensis]|uniref:efflux RND transporter periplasmic adaptor subunit n=1 Tax=Bacillus niameyensis TaxID=1522308 RepID=UPI001E349DE3|nr:efflux RND transporter periplasmic adaptor subunit [Bacillus niameyensis]